jgi:hypothetical protein
VLTTCPGSPDCSNNASEPAIFADPAGEFYASSERGVGSGTLAWRSLTNGLTYQSLLSPNDLSTPAGDAGDEGVEPGGGDTDAATATAPNTQGNYNVYIASLTAAEVDVSTSTDKGLTWTLNPAAGLPGDDREWISATGASKVCVSYLTAPGILLPEFGYHVDCSDDAGATFPQKSDAYDSSAVGLGARAGSRTGNLRFDPSNGNYLYATFAAGTVEDAANPNPTGHHVVGIAVSSDGGKTFNDYVVHNGPVDVDYDNNFPNIAVDRAGNVYDAYSDDHYVYYSYSTDHGVDWHGPFKVSKAGTGIFPWLAAGDDGKVDLVYYYTPYYSADGPGAYPDTALWTVKFAQNLSAHTNGKAWTTTTASPVIHKGGVCQGGVGCTGNRDLYDDFGVAASPTTGMASIVYSDDQYRNDANNKPYPGCTAADNNSGPCDHTAFATQKTGPGIFAPTLFTPAW